MRADLETASDRVRELEAQVVRLRKALQDAKGVFWMAEKYAEAGGAHGPEMRAFRPVQDVVTAALAATEVKP